MSLKRSGKFEYLEIIRLIHQSYSFSSTVTKQELELVIAVEDHLKEAEKPVFVTFTRKLKILFSKNRFLRTRFASCSGFVMTPVQ